MTATAFAPHAMASATVSSAGDLDAERWPLSFTQEACLIAAALAQAGNGSSVPTHFPIALRLRGALDVHALEKSLNVVVHRHRGLTAAYHPTTRYDDNCRRVLLATFNRTHLFIPGLFGQWLYPGAHVRVLHRSMPPLDAPSDEESLGRFARDEAEPSLDTECPPVMRATVTSFGRSDHLLVVTVSHLAVDGWAASIFREELTTIYTAEVLGRKANLRAVTVHAGDFAVSELRRFRSGDFRPHVEYWRRQWDRAAAALVRYEDIPCATGNPVVHRWRACVVKSRVDPSDAALIRGLARRRISPYVFFRTVLTALFHRYTGRRRIAFWANLANRHTGTEWLIASCVRPHMVVVDIPEDVTVSELCHIVDAEIVQAQNNESLPEPVFPFFGLSLPKTVSARISFDAWPTRRAQDADRTIEPVLVGAHPWMDLSIRFRDEVDSFALFVAHNVDRYSTAGAALLLEDLTETSAAFARHIDQRMSTIVCALRAA